MKKLLRINISPPVFGQPFSMRGTLLLLLGTLTTIDIESSFINCASLTTRFFAGRNLLSIDTGYHSMMSPARGRRDKRDYFRGVSGAEYL